MLINFTVEYYRSFGTEQTLNMLATSLKDHPGHCVQIPATDKSVLQTGVIYGANASGKSNLIRAMLFAQQLILGRTTLKALAQSRFRFVKEEKPASFEFRFLANGQVFVYGFTTTHETIIEEWLDASSNTGRETNVFTRQKETIDIGRLRSLAEDVAISRKALRALKDLGVRDDQLLLSKIVELPNQSRGKLLNRVAWWLSKCLTTVPAESHYAPLMDMIDVDEDFRRFCGTFLKNVGTGIDDLSIEKAKIDADKIPKQMLDHLQSPEGENTALLIGGPGVALELDADDPTKVIRKHLNAKHEVNNEDYSISFQEESDGTQRCLSLLPALYHLTQEPRVFIVDEIDRSLHPLLCHALLKLFLDECPGHYQQMIVTTHETHLLDLDLLRRDEIWFMEKDSQQQSRLSSLGDWKTRKDLRIEKGYLQGRFGGIPFIGHTKKLKDMIHCPANGIWNEEETTT
ncbi:AAA family ATPase [Paludisphaera borealis]|uniref:ATPase AAA-type core domain-containing protein n=1 Tax=Paludisphaera borealis TaxID=1387353 RepID=A0A1U7CQC2_9BACT|nr:ATP-binding protein [Paludisphaera borealis]APW61121.1 hypothetical protein BSF38_02625 [Paludisphaera borealis]